MFEAQQSSHPRTREEIDALVWSISPRRQRYDQFISSLSNGLAAHWLAILNTILAVFIGLSALSPVLYSLGLTGPASALFSGYRLVCGQTPSHSFYIAGYQMCLCSRCLAIYSSLLIGGLFLAMHRRRPFFELRPIDWKIWALGMLPMALDGGTQLFGWRESNVYLRLLTGAIFGLFTAWFVLPQIEGTPYKAPPTATPEGATATNAEPQS